MYSFIHNIVYDSVLSEYAHLVTSIILVCSIVLIAFLVKFIAKFIIVKTVTTLAKRTKTKWDNIMLEHKLFHRASYLIIPIVLSLFSGELDYSVLWQKVINIFALVVVLLMLDSLINSIDSIYRTYPISNIKPIRGILQVVKIVLIIFGSIILIAMLVGESPIVLLGGIGAMTAVITLVFKDAILGFVAGIQLTANDMVRIGDWIEMPKYNADGDVVDLTLTTVKVQNFDKTITTIPAYFLVSDSFKNWRGMQSSGGRRIKRAIYLNASDVRICDDEMIERFNKVLLLQDYIKGKQQDIIDYNNHYGGDTSVPVNGRRLTNIGTFRAYIMEYLKQHPGIHKNMILMVRQLSATPTGIPLEVYAFTDTINWVEYEGIQSDIFDHLYSIASFFGLTIFQEPSGTDFNRFLSDKR